MHLYRFYDPLAYEAERCVIFIAANNVEALNAYVCRYFPSCYKINLSKDFHRDDVIRMDVSLKQLADGKVIFSPLFAIDRSSLVMEK